MLCLEQSNPRLEIQSDPEVQYICNAANIEVCIQIPKPSDNLNGIMKPIENVNNCDIFVEENNFLIYIDVKLYRLYSPRKFNVADFKHLDISYDSKERILKFILPCEPPGGNEPILMPPNIQLRTAAKLWRFEQDFDLWKLNRITPFCRIRIDNSSEAQKLESLYCYGFASKFKGKINTGDCELESICRLTEPHLFSPIQRSIDREVDELKDFDRDQYKLNFIDLHVTEGHDNPMDFNINWDEDSMNTLNEESILHNLLLKPKNTLLPEKLNQTEIDCGLVSILLAICYDVRTTSNEPTCESAWTRSILAPLLCYFEPFTNFRDVVIAFLRRSLIYPLYRNYDLGRLCVEDAIDVLQRNSGWVTKQLLITKELFASSESDRDVFNRYFIDDYIRYTCNENLCPPSHFYVLANNVKNVLFDITKKHLRLDLTNIESEVLKEFIPQGSLQINAPGTSEDETTTDDDDPDADDEDDDDGTESDEYETETSSATDTDENSVIEQCIEGFKS